MAFSPASRPFAGAALLLALSASPSPAQGIDLGRATCADFSAMNENDRNQMAVWLAGYYAGGAQRPLLDPDRVTAAPAALQELCAKTPQLPLVGAETRTVFIPPAAP